MGRRQRRRQSSDAPASTRDYVDDEGNVLTLREELSPGALRELRSLAERPAATAEDRWQRRAELLFERLAVSWTIAGLPLTGQRELLGRYRLADEATRQWVRGTLDVHVREHLPEAVA